MKTRSAFTVIEILIVVSIIAVLAAMTLGAIGYLKNHVKRTKTKAIINAAVLGLSTTAMRTNIAISPVEHPLANSRAYSVAPGVPRSLFVRGVTVAGVNKGDAVTTTGEGYLVADPTTVDSSAITSVLMPSDLYCGVTAPSGTDNPMLFGMPRRYLTIIGTGYGLHQVRRLPAISSQHDRSPADGKLDLPYDDAHYPGSYDAALGDLNADTTKLEIDQKKLFDFAFGPEVVTELATLNGVISADDSGSETMGTALICGRRLRAVGPYTATAWDVSQIPKQFAPLVKDVDGTWKPYRLRGPALYDAWHHEILCYTATNGAIVCESAGPDGVFRWNPGGDHTFQTGASDDTPSGDDSDGSKDNIASGQR